MPPTPEEIRQDTAEFPGIAWSGIERMYVPRCPREPRPEWLGFWRGLAQSGGLCEDIHPADSVATVACPHRRYCPALLAAMRGAEL